MSVPHDDVARAARAHEDASIVEPGAPHDTSVVSSTVPRRRRDLRALLEVVCRDAAVGGTGEQFRAMRREAGHVLGAVVGAVLVRVYFWAAGPVRLLLGHGALPSDLASRRASAVKSSALMQRRSKRLELAEICSRAMLSRWTRVLLYSTGFVRARKAARSRIVPVRRRFPSGGVFPQGASWHSGLESFDRGSQIEACRRACAATALTPYL